MGWKEYEMEVMRDAAGNGIIVCSIENLDPMGVHTGDSITVAPAQTLDRPGIPAHARRVAGQSSSAWAWPRAAPTCSSPCNPETGRMVIIEMNPRVSRSSALASKATGFPIAKAAARLAVGYTLDEIVNDMTGTTPACFEPSIDYCVVKAPRFAFEKFQGADDTLTTRMKAVGEVMAVGRTFEEALGKALRSLETGRAGFGADGRGEEAALSDEELFAALSRPTAERIFLAAEALRRGMSAEELHERTAIDPFFCARMADMVRRAGGPARVRPGGYGRRGLPNGEALRALRRRDRRAHRRPTSARCAHAARFLACARPSRLWTPARRSSPTKTAYHYKTYDADESEVAAEGAPARPHPGRRPQPHRPGHRVRLLLRATLATPLERRRGSRPSWSTATPRPFPPTTTPPTRLYFEPLTFEDVMHIVEKRTAPTA